ncbi:Forkhead box protein I1 [Tolypocladium ophioglossoides CBS 100239]|uniref:Forkhead box protein I1 n=1 Tax=Tolypocladium ophioglossoides (strain CBS 100239) TaxID=1163406 RepID=A0A0L0NB20_TOLOC|nr:Forkhead box protein I1 [Tolypocladium ophioglossoides CBS 100239]
MAPPFSDGAEPVRYTTPSRTGSGEQSGCPPGFTETDSLIMSAPAMQEQQHLPYVDSLCSAMCHPPPEHPSLSALFSDSYLVKTTAQSYLRIKSEHAWPSPPLAPGDLDHFDQSHFHHGSPTSAASYIPNYACSPATPGTWSPVSHAIAHPIERLRTQPLPDQQDFSGICTPTSGRNLAACGSDIASPFTDCHCSYDTLPGMPSGLTMDSFDADSLSPEDLLVNTPSSMVTPKTEPPSDCLDDVPHMYPGASPARRMHLQGPDAKLDEPYAKLIYRAFMSRPDHAMTLQDIYQWFRDNTTKAVSEKGGWQNSIRHNLSMNAAFTKRYRKEDGNLPAEDPKRANEWVLEGWAIQFGVQSTTRYRKGNSRRRPSARCANQASWQPTLHSAKRAMSGRKGGCAARDSRLRDLAYGQTMPMGPVPRFGLDRGLPLPSPPRSTMPELYHSESFSLPQFESMAHVPPAQHGLHNGIVPYGGPATEPFGLMLGDGGATNMGHGIHSITEPRSIGAASCGSQMSAAYREPVQSVFPYGIRDVHVGYHGEQQDGADACGTARLFESGSGGICDWADGSM